MQIQYLSDIHLEFYKKLPDDLIKAGADVLCLAGDIGYPYSVIYEEFILRVSKIFKKVFLITGNHEYYNAGCNSNHTMEEIDNHIRDIISENKLTNVTYLDNEYEDYEGYRFIGSTLWSKCDELLYINDFQAIKDMTSKMYNELHEISRDYLQSDDIINSPLPIIVITHHLPSFKLIADKYKNQINTNKYFASNSDDLFNVSIKVWIYGHTHIGGEKEIDGIKFVCNPVGYPGENSHKLKTKVLII